jgi:hypothetical protein
MGLDKNPLRLQTDSQGQKSLKNVKRYKKKRNDKNGCWNIYVPNDKTFDPCKIQKFTGYNRKNSIEKS